MILRSAQVHHPRIWNLPYLGLESRALVNPVLKDDSIRQEKWPSALGLADLDICPSCYQWRKVSLASRENVSASSPSNSLHGTTIESKEDSWRLVAQSDGLYLLWLVLLFRGSRGCAALTVAPVRAPLCAPHQCTSSVGSPRPVIQSLQRRTRHPMC